MTIRRAASGDPEASQATVEEAFQDTPEIAKNLAVGATLRSWQRKGGPTVVAGEV